MKRRIAIYFIMGLTACLPPMVEAQRLSPADKESGSLPLLIISLCLTPTFPLFMEGDTISCMYLRDFVNYSPYLFLSTKEQVAYSKLVRDVKKTLPYAKEIAAIILETYEYMKTLPNDKARQKHLNQMEKYLKQQYTPKMKKFPRSQGQLLIKLMDRETSSSSYHIIDAFMGSFKAWGYNLFASMFGNSLKIRYNRYGEDRDIERVCVLVEKGII